jgi:integrase
MPPSKPAVRTAAVRPPVTRASPRGPVFTLAAVLPLMTSSRKRIREPADKRRSFRLEPEGYRAVGEALDAAEHRGEHWQAIAVIRLLALTGCRRSEILNLKWSEVDFKSSCLRLSDTKTGASIRPLPAAARAILARIERNGDYVFPGVTRADRSYASVFPKAWLRVVGRSYSPHGLRHAYASAAHEVGEGELTIKALLGHARVGVTGGYIKPMDGLLLAAAEKVSQYISEVMTGKRAKVLDFSSQSREASERA